MKKKAVLSILALSCLALMLSLTVAQPEASAQVRSFDPTWTESNPSIEMIGAARVVPDWEICRHLDPPRTLLGGGRGPCPAIPCQTAAQCCDACSHTDYAACKHGLCAYGW